jgi:hypothetical protein
MKKIILFIAIGTMMFMGCGLDMDSDNQSITVKRNEFKYQFTAEFPKRKTEQVIKYINTTLNEEKLFTDPNEQKDTIISLGDTVRFHLVSEPGYIEIKFRKTDNPPSSYKKLEQMCMGIKDVLK